MSVTETSIEFEGLESPMLIPNTKNRARSRLEIVCDFDMLIFTEVGTETVVPSRLLMDGKATTPVTRRTVEKSVENDIADGVGSRTGVQEVAGI